MKRRSVFSFARGFLLLTVCPAICGVNGGTSVLLTHTTTRGDETIAQGAAQSLTSVSVGQNGIVSPPITAGRFSVTLGFQAMLDGFDSDEDGTPDHADADDDGDGVGDAEDSHPYDTDGDGANNVCDRDDDGDGLNDTDEREQGTSTTRRNTDGDNHDDFQEWIAGTDGTSSNSVFRITSVDERAGEGIELRWDGAAFRRYSVYRAAGLPDSPRWLLLWQTNTVETAPLAYRDTASGKASFYRVHVERP